MEINTTQSPSTVLKTMPPKNLPVAVAKRANGKTKLLDIDTPLRSGKRDAGTGFPEGELALVELFRESSQPRFLALAAFFADQRKPRKVNLPVQLRSSAPLKAIWQEDLLGKIIGYRSPRDCG